MSNQKSTTMFLHTFYTWFLANSLHPAMFMLVWFVNSGYREHFFISGTMEICSLIFVVSLIISLPALLVGWLLFGMIALSNYTILARFILWLFSASALVAASFLLLSCWIDGHADGDILSLSVPGIIAVIATIGIRYKQFEKLVRSLHVNEHDNEPL